jgi:hypothetical protein
MREESLVSKIQARGRTVVDAAGLILKRPVALGGHPLRREIICGGGFVVQGCRALIVPCRLRYTVGNAPSNACTQQLRLVAVLIRSPLPLDPEARDVMASIRLACAAAQSSASSRKRHDPVSVAGASRLRRGTPWWWRYRCFHIIVYGDLCPHDVTGRQGGSLRFRVGT